jgi:hypothetical protein
MMETAIVQAAFSPCIYSFSRQAKLKGVALAKHLLWQRN